MLNKDTVLVDDTEHKANCMAYAHNFLFLCDMAGIPCIHVHSGTHEWNEVYVENRWWSVDVGGTDVNDASWRVDLPVLHEASYLQGATYQQTEPELTTFAKELLIPCSTK